MRYSNGSERIGEKLLPRIVHAVVQGIVHAKYNLANLEQHNRVKATQAIIDKIGHEVADHYGPIADILLAQDDGSLHPAVRAFLEDARTGEDQVKAIGGLLMGAGQSAIGTFLSNELAPIVYKIVGANPNLYPDVGTVAALTAQRLATSADLFMATGAQGIIPAWADSMHQGSLSWPAIADAIDMRRRGFIGDGEFKVILERNAVPDGLIEAWTRETNAELSLADAALAYLRSDISLQEAEAIAAANGYTSQQFSIFLGNVGEPLAPQQLAEALRRGFITQDDFTRGIKQSRIRNEWIPTALALRYVPMSVADAVNAAVQNHITQDAASAIADQNGLAPGNFPILYETAGEPLSRTELEQLYNRGLIPETVVKQGLAESRLKNKYIDDAFALHERLPEPRILSSAVEDGALSHADAVAIAMEYGYSQANAEILVSSASNRKLKTERERVVSAATGLYEENAISQDAFLTIAQAMGYDATEANFIAQSAEYRRQAKVVTAVINAIRSKFISHHYDVSVAGGLLDALGVPSDRRDFLLANWAVEAAANVRLLTPAQIVKAVKLQLISEDDGKARLDNLGYSADDASLLLQGA